LRSLIEGNQRFYSGASLYPRRDSQRRAEVLGGQRPIAALLTCSDSRVPPEILFDQGLGDLFLVRAAGNIAGPVGLGSLEYAVEHLAVPLIVVLGHQKCGAVSVAVQGREAPGHVQAIVETIAPVVESVRQHTGDLLANAIDANVLAGVEKLKGTGPVLAEFAGQGKIEVVGARYNLDTGQVEWLAGSPAMMELFPAPAGRTAEPTLPPTEGAAAPPTATLTPEPQAGADPRILGVHIVRRGETLFAIGQAYGVHPAAIASENNLTNPNLIYTGQRLRIPNVPWKQMPPGKAAARQF
jgi:carbonic anhydrase